MNELTKKTLDHPHGVFEEIGTTVIFTPDTYGDSPLNRQICECELESDAEMIASALNVISAMRTRRIKGIKVVK